ncbi:MAG TPA: phosphatase PAP2 family protein [Herpetosiphonaceae bacterium]|nr:phosphatase PAP2 family protein [Herpetosiphonaceae bacterium]
MQLDFIKWLQSFHSPVLDKIMLWVTSVGGEDFYLLFGPIFFWCVGIGMGVRLCMILLGSFYLNDVLKEAFATLRPIVAHPDQVRMPAEAAITAQDGLGNWQGAFPSGHAQHTVVFWAFVALWLRRPAAWAAALAMIALVSLSRIYLGVHWPIDILGGWLLGAAFIAAAVLVPPLIERLAPRQREWLLLAAGAGSVALFLIDGSIFRAKMLGFLGGALFSLVLQQRYLPFKVGGSPSVQVAKAAIGLAGLFVLRAGLKLALPLEPWGEWLRYVALGAWIILGAPAIFRLLFGAPAAGGEVRIQDSEVRV